MHYYIHEDVKKAVTLGKLKIVKHPNDTVETWRRTTGVKKTQKNLNLEGKRHVVSEKMPTMSRRVTFKTSGNPETEIVFDGRNAVLRTGLEKNGRRLLHVQFWTPGNGNVTIRIP